MMAFEPVVTISSRNWEQQDFQEQVPVNERDFKKNIGGVCGSQESKNRWIFLYIYSYLKN